jgi:hypothetical protein
VVVGSVPSRAVLGRALSTLVDLLRRGPQDGGVFA